MERRGEVEVPSLAPAVTRAARLLDLLADSGQPLTLSDLALRLRIAKSSAFALCSALCESGLLARLPSGGYELGVHVMDLANAYLRQTNLVQAFHAILGERNVLPRHTINLSVLDGVEVVYLTSRAGTSPLGLEFRMGARLPAFQAATGRALLGTLSPERLDDKMARFRGLRLTPRTETNPRRLRRALEREQQQGYTVDEEELREGLVCFGAPVFGPHGAEAVAGVAVAMPKSAATAEVRRQAIAEIRELARLLSQRLGAR